MNKKGFTLIELIVVIIVIGILATFAVPQYMKAVTKAKIAKAKNALALIVKAEELYRNAKDTYINCAATSDVITMGTDSGVDLAELTNDVDWNYSVVSANTTSCGARATGNSTASVINGRYITLWTNGTWASSNTTVLPLE